MECGVTMFMLYILVAGIYLQGYAESHKLPAVRPIIHMIPHCPPSLSQNTSVQLKADVPVVAEVHCRYGRVFNMQRLDDVTYGIEATFSDINDSRVCAFQKKQQIAVFVLPVNVLWGDGEGEVLKFWHRTILTCGFDPHGSQASAPQEMSDETLPLRENQRNKGPESDVEFKVLLLDVLGNPVDGLPVGRKTQLKAVMTRKGGQEEVGFHVTSCNAIGMSFDTNTTYGIIRGGCGDGKVFSKGEGFTTMGTIGYSPYFQAFRLMGSNLLTFECNFTLCGQHCNGSSCDIEDNTVRHRRSAISPGGSSEGSKAVVHAKGKDESKARVFTARTSVVPVEDKNAPLIKPGPEHFPALSEDNRKMRRRNHLSD